MRQTKSTEKDDLPFSKLLREWRWAAELTIDDAAYVATRLLPDVLGISRETVRRLESNEVAEEKSDPLKVAAMARAYGHNYCELSALAAKRAKAITALFESPKAQRRGKG
jgi:hypothetical protein